jgi:hypothetical protein
VLCCAILVVQRFLLSAAGDRIRDDRKDPENADEEKRPEQSEEEEAGIELQDAQMQTDDLPRVETHEKQGDKAEMRAFPPTAHVLFIQAPYERFVY